MHYSQQNNISPSSNLNCVSYGMNTPGHIDNRYNRRRRPRNRRGDYNTRYSLPPMNISPQTCSKTNVNHICPHTQLGPNHCSSPVVVDTQMITTGPTTYIQHPDYSGGQEFRCSYSNYYQPQNNLVQSNQNTTVQNPVYYSTLPVYNNQPIFNYGYIIPPSINTNEYTTFLNNNNGIITATGTPHAITTVAPIEQNPVVTSVCTDSNSGLVWQQPQVYSNYCISPEINANITSNLNTNNQTLLVPNNECNVVIPNYVEGNSCGQDMHLQHQLHQQENYHIPFQQHLETENTLQSYNNMQMALIQENITQSTEETIQVNII